MAVLAPPFLTDCGVVFPKLQEVAEERDCAGYLGQTFDMRNVGGERDLCVSVPRINNTEWVKRWLRTW